MPSMELHRGRLVDHIQLVVADVAASRRFYDAVMGVLGIPLGGSADSHFWYDELFVSTPDGPEAAGKLTGRHHLAFQAADRARSTHFTKPGSPPAAATTAPRASVPTTTRAITPPSCSILTATISRRCSTARRSAARPRWRSASRICNAVAADQRRGFASRPTAQETPIDVRP